MGSNCFLKRWGAQLPWVERVWKQQEFPDMKITFDNVIVSCFHPTSRWTCQRHLGPASVFRVPQPQGEPSLALSLCPHWPHPPPAQPRGAGLALPLTTSPDSLTPAFLFNQKKNPEVSAHQPGFKYQFSWSCGSLRSQSPRVGCPSSAASVHNRVGGASGAMLRHVSGGLFSPAQPRRAGPAKEGQAPSQGVLLPTLEGPLLLPGMAYRPRASSALHPTGCKSAPSPHPPLCLTLANLSSLFLSSAPSWPPCLPGDFAASS